MGGFINQYANWRWTFYVLLIWAGTNLATIAFLVPETYHPVLLRAKARKMRKETGESRWIAPMEKMNKSIPKTIACKCAESPVFNKAVLSSEHCEFRERKASLTVLTSPRLPASAIRTLAFRANVHEPLSLLRYTSRDFVSLLWSVSNCVPRQSWLHALPNRPKFPRNIRWHGSRRPY